MRDVGLELWDRSSPALCSIQVQNPGASGGLTSVTTDGSLTGSGTSGSPLKIPAANFFTPYPAGSSSAGPGAANKLALTGFTLYAPLTFAHIIIDVSTPDGSNASDLGIYNAAGTLLANVGPATYGTAAVVTAAFLQGSQEIFEGNYFFALTSAANTIRLLTNLNSWGWVNQSSYGASTAGTLPASVTAPTLLPASTMFWITLY